LHCIKHMISSISRWSLLPSKSKSPVPVHSQLPYDDDPFPAEFALQAHLRNVRRASGYALISGVRGELQWLLYQHIASIFFTFQMWSPLPIRDDSQHHSLDESNNRTFQAHHDEVRRLHPDLSDPSLSLFHTIHRWLLSAAYSRTSSPAGPPPIQRFSSFFRLFGSQILLSPDSRILKAGKRSILRILSMHLDCSRYIHEYHRTFLRSLLGHSGSLNNALPKPRDRLSFLNDLCRSDRFNNPADRQLLVRSRAFLTIAARWTFIKSGSAIVGTIL